MISSVLALVTIFFTIRGKCTHICLKQLFFNHVRATIHTVVTDWDCSILLQAGTQQETIHLCFQIERSHWFHCRAGRSHLGWKMDIPCCPALSHTLLLVSFTAIHREKKDPCCRTSHQRTVPWLIASVALSRFGATHGRLRLSTCAVEVATASLFLQWHFDRLMLFACQGFTHCFLLPALISPPPTAESPSSCGVKGQREKAPCLISPNEAVVCRC